MAKGRDWILTLDADTHCNSRLGLVPPEGAKLGDGEGKYVPGPTGLWLWSCWEHHWSEVAYLRRHLKANLGCLLNGDLRDGPMHHGNVQQIAGDNETEAFCSERVFSVPRALKPNTFWVTIGTEAHTGPGGSGDSAVARYLRAQRDPVTDSWASYWIRGNLNGLSWDARHHGRGGGRPWTTGGIAGLAAEIALEHMNVGEPCPRLAIRSHKHRHADSGSLVKSCRVISTAAWTLKSSFGHKVAAESLADIGGHVVVIHPDATFEVIDHLYKPALPQVRSA